jgi:RHS repeat-associated protein
MSRSLSSLFRRQSKISILRPVLALLLVAIWASSAPAQVASGTPPFGSFAGGPDVIDLANLNTHVSIPIVNKPGRGMPFNYNITYDSSIWSPSGSSGSQLWWYNSNWGMSVLGQSAGYVSYRSTSTVCTINGRNYHGVFVYYNWRYTDRFGVGHAFQGDTYMYVSPCGTGTTSLQATAQDGSGYMLSAQGNSGYIVAGTGTTLNPGASAYATDRNGNQLSLSGSGVFTDTLGTTALTTSGTAPNPVTFTYTAPSGANATYTVKYTAYTVQTNFNCQGISEYGPIANNLVSEIDLPDYNLTTNPNSRYTFVYETTPNDSHNPHYVTGRLASITLPTGGTITYAYSGGGTGVNGISCTDGSAATVTRTTPDGTWIYAQVKGSGAASTTTITDPLNNQTVIQFQGIYETQRQVYQGSTSGTLLKTINTCYNGNTTNCTTTGVGLPITQRNVTDIWPGANNLQCQHVYKYNSTGSLTEQDDYDYGAPGALLKKTVITYASLGNNITALRQQVTVTNGAGTTISQTKYNYDGTSVVATSGTPQQITVSGSRGNLTSVNYYTNGSTFLTKSFTYFDTGNVQTTTDVNGAQTTYSTFTCGNAFPTSVSEPLNLSRSMTWNCAGGVQLTSVDENNQTTTVALTDPYFWRPATLTDPTNAATNVTYTSPTQAEVSLSFNSGNSSADGIGTRDSLGRQHVSQVREAPGSPNFDSVEVDYDALGRQSRVTLPYVGTVGQTSSSAPARTTTYDALNRTLSISDNSLGSRTFSYTQNDVYVTRGPAPTGENTKRRQEEFDGLGRLTSVCEITAGTTYAPAGTCAQNSSQTGYWTKYTYDALGRLTAVSQNAQSSNPQSRTYVYDLVGRITSESNPETGTTTYTYDTDTTCGTSSGDLVKKTDAVSNVTCTAYDAFHRPTVITYPSGAYSSVTPAKHFVYDSATVHNVTMNNVKGRLAEAYTCTGACSSNITDEGFTYTLRGEPSDVYESTPNSGGYYHVSAQYWATSALKQIGSLTGLPTITYTPDGEGRIYQVSASSGQNPVTNTVFNAASLPTSITYGSSDSDAFSYDPNTNRLTQYQFTVNGQSLTGALTWNADHTLASKNITDPFNSADAQNCSYTHDDLTRLASVNCGTVWSQTFAYDAFGNISKSGSQIFQPIYKDTSGNTTNRFVSIPGVTVSYDANGNVLADGSHTYSMDSAGKPVTIDSVNVTYDALGRAVEQNRTGTYTQIVYSPGGAKLAIMNGQTLQKGLVPLPGGGVAVYNSSGLLYYGHSDHLGSIKLGSTTSRTISFDLAYAPFGETYAPSGTTDPAFTGQRQDTVAGLYDFPARRYSTQGRWPAPDPLGLASMHLSDPQSLNRYAYVRNNPLVMIDPQGLDAQDEGPCGDGNDGDCGPSGPVDCLNTSCGTDPNNQCGGDPTCGGDQNNSGGNCPPNSSDCFTVAANDPSNGLMVEVTASVSDGPTIETESAPINGTLLQECSCLLGLMQNDQASSTILVTTNDIVQAAGYAEILPLTAPVAAPYYGDILILGLAGTFAANSIAQSVEESTGPPDTGHNPANEPNGGFTGADPGSISGKPPEPPPPFPPNVQVPW